MHPLIIVGFVAFYLVSFAVGVRLLMLWMRTYALPELLMGVGVLGLGPIGFGGSAVSAQLQSSDPALAQIVFAISGLAGLSGAIATCLFNWLVFRPQSRVGMALTIAVGLSLLGIYAGRAISIGFVPDATARSTSNVQFAITAFALLWGAFESLRYWALMRKRSSLGLADPVVTNRFLMWGIGSGMAAIGTGIATIVSMLSGVSTLESPGIVASSSAHGFVSALAIWLAFLPPARYQQWLRARHARATALELQAAG